MSGYNSIEATEHVNKLLLDYNLRRQFRIYDSFPLISDDPSLIFTNATITPFKHLFLDENVPHNYALVQQCLRVGGGAGDPSFAMSRPNYSSVFEMFGSGFFGYTYNDAVAYFIGMLTHVGVSFESLHFTVPDDGPFRDALLLNGVNPNKIHGLKENGFYWHAWKFGKNGLLGSGITAVHVPPESTVRTIEDMALQPDVNIEIGNLIHVYAKEIDGCVGKINNVGFEVGMGSARLAVILKGKTLWEMPPFLDIYKAVDVAMFHFSGRQSDNGAIRIVADHLRTISILIMNGVLPGNKREEFVLRKMIRTYSELIWIASGKIASSVSIVQAFVEAFIPLELVRVVEVIEREESRFRMIQEKGVAIMRRSRHVDQDLLMGTYGIRPQLVSLLL